MTDSHLAHEMTDHKSLLIFLSLDNNILTFGDVWCRSMNRGRTPGKTVRETSGNGCQTGINPAEGGPTMDGWMPIWPAG